MQLLVSEPADVKFVRDMFFPDTESIRVTVARIPMKASYTDEHSTIVESLGMRGSGTEVKFFKSVNIVPVVFRPSDVADCYGKQIELIEGTTIIRIIKYFLTNIIF